MITFSGVHVTKEFGAPNVRDISVQLMRLIRFGGAGEIPWPVGMHSLLVTDLLPKNLEVYGLLHDAAECCVADVPRPMKTDAARKVEGAVQARIYAHLGVRPPTAKQARLVHDADCEAGMAEGANGCGARGYVQTMTAYKANAHAIALLQSYLNGFQIEDAMNSEGKWPLMFEARLLCALREMRSNINYKEAA